MKLRLEVDPFQGVFFVSPLCENELEISRMQLGPGRAVVTRYHSLHILFYLGFFWLEVILKLAIHNQKNLAFKTWPMVYGILHMYGFKEKYLEVLINDARIWQWPVPATFFFFPEAIIWAKIHFHIGSGWLVPLMTVAATWQLVATNSLHDISLPTTCCETTRCSDYLLQRQLVARHLVVRQLIAATTPHAKTRCEVESLAN